MFDGAMGEILTQLAKSSLLNELSAGAVCPALPVNIVTGANDNILNSAAFTLAGLSLQPVSWIYHLQFIHPT